jgi:hypothetical protein
VAGLSGFASALAAVPDEGTDLAAVDDDDTEAGKGVGCFESSASPVLCDKDFAAAHLPHWS